MEVKGLKHIISYHVPYEMDKIPLGKSMVITFNVRRHGDDSDYPMTFVGYFTKAPSGGYYLNYETPDGKKYLQLTAEEILCGIMKLREII